MEINSALPVQNIVMLLLLNSIQAVGLTSLETTRQTESIVKDLLDMHITESSVTGKLQTTEATHLESNDIPKNISLVCATSFRSWRRCFGKRRDLRCLEWAWQTTYNGRWQWLSDRTQISSAPEPLPSRQRQQLSASNWNIQFTGVLRRRSRRRLIAIVWRPLEHISVPDSKTVSHRFWW